MMSQSVKRSFILGAAAVIAAVAPIKHASATVGQLPLCVGTYKCGMAGAGLSIASDPTAATINPALSARMGNSAIISAGWFKADVERDYSNINSGMGGNTAGGKQKSDSSDFFNGSLGVNYRLDDQIGVNISIYPGGGGATDWNDARTTNDLSQDRMIRWRMFNMQLAAAYAPNKTSSYGLGLVLTRADMKTDSIYAGPAFTNNNNPQVVDVVYGAGFNIGGVWDLGDKMTVAADYQSKVWVQRFDKYINVFNSTVDRPATFSIGLDMDVADDTVVAIDAKYIHNGGVRTISSKASGEGGFGWDDVGVLMIGVEHQVTDELQLRAGFSYNNSPIDDSNLYANTLFPAIIKTHYTVGGTYAYEEFEFGFSAYITGKSKLTETGLGDNGAGNSYSAIGKNGWISHQQYGSQLSVKYNF